MSDDVEKRALRRGWTTGTCATAAAAAAYQAYLTGAFPDPVTVQLPRGMTATLPLHRAELGLDSATVGIIKDAGDDPDVTHGAEVIVTVVPGVVGSGVTFRGGVGVGTVTLPGLPIPPGEPAINPGPRAMIRSAVTEIAARCKAAGDVVVTIAVPAGITLAEKTLNGRLGIVGGLSVLGTTGIVVPFSCSAWIHSIHRGIDVARAAGLEHLAAATGSTSEAALKRLYRLADPALIDMGDFIGGTLKYLRAHPVRRLTIAGGFAKLVKLAQGHLYVHSAKSQVDVTSLAATLADLGAGPAALSQARAARSAAQVLAIARADGIALGERIASDARKVAAATLAPASIALEVIAFDRAGQMIGRAGFDA
ncbi:MAG: cobalt-precorrin-5B (C(1))-methyltransferase [Rhodospirillales bacterium]|nr:cobalt-precorrin-5B (C(1))-methyltransferase [Rhodospirillales bacterium]